MRRFFKIRPLGGGAWLVTEKLGDLEDMLDNDRRGVNYELRTIYLTEEQAAALGDFDGW